MQHSIRSILNKLYELRVASYLFEQKEFLAGSKDPVVESWFYRELIDPSDLRVGAKYVQTLPHDQEKMVYLYDGRKQVQVNWENRTLFKHEIKQIPGKPVPNKVPFYTRIKGLINYTLDSDSAQIEVDESKVKVVKIDFPNQLVVAQGRKAIFVTMSKPGRKDFSNFELHLNSDGLPVYLRSESSLGLIEESISNLQVNRFDPGTLDLQSLIPSGFSEIEPEAFFFPDISNAPAPDWELADLDGKIVNLTHLTGQVIVLCFTGIRCGPCHRSVPFLKRLVDDYRDKKLSLVSIESPAGAPEELPDAASDDGIPRFIWYGHSVLLLRFAGRNLLIDPMFGPDA
ncbi:MAG: redoxin domain-containing protein, partial [Saprospiraceae bacterium]|nr:redoxin domain-containing protein [Saprospiraceae bacterium]